MAILFIFRLHINMSSILSECEIQCLVWAVACGRSVKSWAAAHGLDVTIAQESTRRPGFDELVAGHRVRLAERTAVTLSSLSPPAIDQLLRLSRYSSAAADKRSAERALLKRQRGRSRRDGTAKRIADLEKRLRLREFAARAD
jgi:hypothetical protein